ncbi:MAG: NADH-quinone oxidoreductase subunit J, partial [Nitrospirota bacterium]
MLSFLFFYLAGVTVISSILVISLRNIVYSVLALLVAFIHIAGLYLLLNAEFIAAMQIVIY